MLLYLTQIEAHAGTLYDAVMLLAHALNKTLEAGDDVENGTAVARNMFNNTVYGNIITL